MGTSGLWNYINNHGLCSQVPSGKCGASIITPNHLFLDMNAVVHSTIRHKTFSSNELIRDVIASVQRLIQLFPPSNNLVIVFDGAAPCAKLKVQKERRAGMPIPQFSLQPPSLLKDSKYNYDYFGTGVKLVREEILSGSEILLACEDAVRQALSLDSNNNNNNNNKNKTIKLPTGCNTIISGCEESGEGEVKMSFIIRQLWIEQQKNKTYNGEDTIIFVGNDSDLILVGISCTPYRNFFLIDPIDFAITSIGKLFNHWMKGVPNGTLPLELLPSYRIDFVFLMLLGGGDWFQGVGSRNVLLWRRYRELRLNGGYFRRALVRGASLEVDVEFLRAVTDLKPAAGNKRRMSKMQRAALGAPATSAATATAVEGGLALLRGAMWALRTIVTGQCADYALGVSSSSLLSENNNNNNNDNNNDDNTDNNNNSNSKSSRKNNYNNGKREVTTGSLRAAAHTRGVAERINSSPVAPLPLLAPLAQCLAVLGRRGRFSAELHRALTIACPDDAGDKISRSQSVSYLIPQIRRILSVVDTEKLSPAERALLKVQHRSTTEEMEDCKTEEKTIPLVNFMNYVYKPPSKEEVV